MSRPCVDLPYAQPPLPLARLSQARALVSQELSRDSNAQNVLREAAELSASKQRRILEMMSNSQQGFNASLKGSSQNLFLSTVTRSQVLGSHGSGNAELHLSRGGEENGLRSACASNLTMLEPMPKHPRYESSAGTFTSKKSTEEGKPDSRICDEGSSLVAGDAVYFESLLGQLVGADLFLRFSNIECEGEIFLQRMQQRQEELFGLKKYIEELNALRCVEQRDFAVRMDNVQAQITKLQTKNAALAEILGSSAKKNTQLGIVRRSPGSILRSLGD